MLAASHLICMAELCAQAQARVVSKMQAHDPRTAADKDRAHQVMMDNICRALLNQTKFVMPPAKEHKKNTAWSSSVRLVCRSVSAADVCANRCCATGIRVPARAAVFLSHLAFGDAASNPEQTMPTSRKTALKSAGGKAIMCTL